MSKNRQITAFFLLGAFLVMMVHNAMPHDHHFHESPEGVAIYADHDHHSNEDHSHSDDHESKSQDHNSLLSFLTDSHSHFFHIHEFVQFTKADASLLKAKVLPTAAKIAVFDFLSDIESQGLDRYVVTKESWSENPFLLSCSLRAPPSIG